MTNPAGLPLPALPVITIAGAPEALGAAHGEAVRDLIRDVFRWRMDEIVAASGEDEVTVLERAGRYLPAAGRLAPQLIDEVRGIGRGSGLGFERAFFLQVATEVALEAGPWAAGCSAVGSAVGPGAPLVAQNWDQPSTSAGKQVVLHMRPAGRPEILMFGHAGVVGYIGLNDRGLGHVGNQLYSATAAGADGLTQYFINRRLLEFDDAAAALDWLTSVPVASTCNYLLGDASGDLADVELGNGRATVQARGPAMAHTNYYLLERFAPADGYAAVLPDSPARLAALRAGATGVGSLQDHSGNPAGVCRHEEPPGLTTRASIVLRLGARELAVASGPPCVTQYATYRFDAA